jgi:hypothetical protein
MACAAPGTRFADARPSPATTNRSSAISMALAAARTGEGQIRPNWGPIEARRRDEAAAGIHPRRRGC